MNKIFSLLIFLSFPCLAEPIKVAIIDTGFDFKYISEVPICAGLSRDFTGEGLNDFIGHGTNVTGLITKDLKKLNYCVVFIKAFSKNQKYYLSEALEYAAKINADIVNLSAGGLNPDSREKRATLNLLNKKVTIVTAAGNDLLDLDKSCIYYPACYDNRINVIGNFSKLSNYGAAVDKVIDGNNKTAFGITESGTSMSAAIFTNQLLKALEK